MTRECQKAKKIGIFKLVFMIIGIFMGSISSFLAGDIPSPPWRPGLASRLQPSGNHLGFMVQITILSLSQLLHICIIAQDVEHASERIFDVAVQMDWIGADIKIKKLLLIFMSNLNCL
jgi:hypothetical protein